MKRPGAARTEQLVPVQCRGARRHAVLDLGALLADLAGAKRTRSSQVIRHHFGRPYLSANVRYRFLCGGVSFYPPTVRSELSGPHVKSSPRQRKSYWSERSRCLQNAWCAVFPPCMARGPSRTAGLGGRRRRGWRRRRRPPRGTSRLRAQALPPPAPAFFCTPPTAAISDQHSLCYLS